MTSALCLTWLATFCTLWAGAAAAHADGLSRSHQDPPSRAPSQAPSPQPPVGNRPPTVRARCEPCKVRAGRKSAVSADATDPDGDTLTYHWSAPAGTFQNPVDRQTVWTAPAQPDSVVATVTVNDGRGGSASASITLQVLSPRSFVGLNFEEDDDQADRSKVQAEARHLVNDGTASPAGLAAVPGCTRSLQAVPTRAMAPNSPRTIKPRWTNPAAPTARQRPSSRFDSPWSSESRLPGTSTRCWKR
jgi:hypothetical protein